jgi:CRISP-associated protein Cas1
LFRLPTILDHDHSSIFVKTAVGIEGAGSAAYFRCFGMLLTNPKQWHFPGRVRRPPTDPVNALLSFGYSLVTNKVASAVQLVGFDHSVGYLHSSFSGRPALALDLMEEFRPVIVDAVVLALLNNRMLTANDFLTELEAYRLKNEPRNVFAKLADALVAHEESVRFSPLCATCVSKVETVGGLLPHDDDIFIL